MNSSNSQVMRLHGDGNVVIVLGAIARGGPILRYGQIIGVTTRDIRAGEHVHEHNMGMGGTGPSTRLARPAAPEPRTFHGFRRADGRAGTRNYLGILT